MNYRSLIPVVLAIVVLSGIALYLKDGTPKVEASIMAAEMVAKCAQDGGSCYEAEVPELYPTYSIPEIFEIIRHIRGRDQNYQFCHVLAHKLGEIVVAEDPNQWMKAMPLNPNDGMCSNGFVHGVVGGRFRAEVLDDETLATLISDFRRACEPHDDWAPTPLDQAICYHGMGHLYVFITDADLKKALTICEQTAVSEKSDYGQVCREGVFMQIYQPLEPDDFLMIERMEVKPSTTTVRQFCKAYSENPKYEGACLRESWPFFREEIVRGDGVDTFCSGQPNEQEETNCYRSATAIIGRMSLSNSRGAANACAALQEKYRALCFTTIATAVLEENRTDVAKAIEVCDMSTGSVKNECFSDLARRSRFIYGANESQRMRFCDALPSEHQANCRR